MVKTTFLPLVIIYCIKKIPLNIYDKPPIPEESMLHTFISLSNHLLYVFSIRIRSSPGWFLPFIREAVFSIEIRN